MLGLSINESQLEAQENAIRAAVERETFRSFGAPAAWDWRSHGGDWTTSIKDQQTCGSCVSFATCATVEAAIKIVCNDTSLQPDLSEAHLFSCGCGDCCGSGWYFPPALEFARNTGLAVESAFPYQPQDQPCPPNVPIYLKINSWDDHLGLEERKTAISSGGPVVAGMRVYEDFYHYTQGVYRHVTGSDVGGHAVCVVGYDDAEQCWIAKNSWGTGWGDNGWFKIGYGECGLDTQFAFYSVEVDCPQAPEPEGPTCDEYIPYLVRVLRVARRHAELRRCLRYFVCGWGSRPFCSPGVVSVVASVLHILAQCPRYRAPFCRVLA